QTPQKELAKKLDIPASILSNIEKGKRLVPKNKIPLFIKELNLKEEELLPATASVIHEIREDIKSLEKEIGIGFRELKSLPDEARQELIAHFKELKERYEKNNSSMPTPERPAEVAERVIRQCRIGSAPVDLNKIAKENSIEISESTTIDADGWILFPKDQKWAAIKVNKKISSLGRKRFTIAHEMGHFFLKNVDMDEKSCQIDSGQKTEHEREADEFASNLLMPEKLIKKTIGIKIKGYEDILKIGQAFEVSQQAAGLRLMQVTSVPAAVIYSENGLIKWGKTSSNLYLKIKRDHKLGRLSQASKILDKGFRGLVRPIETKCEYWFHGRMRGKFMEHSSGIYENRVLSIIWIK
ncbi:MAG: ImmA/IrrE family metallo-endopeptidase, partial [Candidatus Vogelbacteria bacterium]|nr:ImmA/IrrE family metallo-endopeptidase [Candidatus Vogelbacteria bacterium]